MNDEEPTSGTTTRIQHALLFEYKKPRDGERPPDKIEPMSYQEVRQRLDYWSVPRSTSTVRRITHLTRTVVTTRSEWEPGESATPKPGGRG